MDWIGTAYIIVLALATVVSLALSGMAWRRRPRRGALIIALHALLVAVWAASSGLEPLAATLRGKELWVNCQYFGYALLPVTSLCVALAYADIERWLARPRLALLLVVPAITIAAAWTNDLHHLMRFDLHPEPSGGYVFLGKTYGPWLWVHMAYSYLLVAAGAAIIARAALRARSPYRRQARVLFAAQVIPAGWTIPYVFHAAWVPRMDLGPAVASMGAALMAYAILRLGLCDIVPVAHHRVVESMRDGVLVIDNLGRLVEMNGAAERLLGAAPRSLVGLPLKQALGRVPALLPCLNGAAAPSAQVDVDVGGERRFWDVHVSPLAGGPGGDIGRVVLIQDATERRRADEERRRMEQRVLEAQKLESLALLAGGVAHDFNNILQGIMNQTELALMQLHPEARARANLDKVLTSTERAAVLAGQMLAYSGKGAFVLRRVDLSAAVTDAADLLRSAAGSGVTMSLALAEDLPPILADVQQLRQLLVNLAANAAEATEPGGRIEIRTDWLHAGRALLDQAHQAAGLPEGTYVELTVADNGCGMDAATRERVFDPFFTTKFIGRGLGMAAVLGIVRGHHGGIQVASEPGAGTTVRVLFPAAGDVSRMPA